MKGDWWSIPKIAFSSRNPVSWFWGALWLVFYPLLAVLIGILGAVFGLVQLAWFWHLNRVANDARTTEVGVEVFSKKKGQVSSHSWASISQLRCVFEPPLTYWELVLTNGEAVALPLAELEIEVFRAHGITVHGKPKFRHEYTHDG